MGITRVNGRAFSIEERGSGKPLVLLHGFTGSARSWSAVTEILSQRHRTVAIDLLGHGRSAAPNNADRYAFETAIDDLAGIALELEISNAAWLGYSMGGRLALGLAVTHPDLVTQLLLESASPGIRDPAERAERRAADNALAATIEHSGIEAFVDRWERHPLWQSQARLPPEVSKRQREIRLGNRAAGLAGSLRGMGTGAQPSYWSRLGEVDAPALVSAGALDAKFSEIAMRMATLFPRGTGAIVPDAGHAVHLEQPARYAALISEFISPVD